MRMLRMLSGLAVRLLRGGADKGLRGPGRETEDDGQAAGALAAMRDANAMDEVARAEVALGGCYRDGVAYSLAYDVNGVVELCGETFTSLDTGIDGGAQAALRRHRQNYDPGRDVERFIVVLRPVRVVNGVGHGAPYGLPPGPLAGNPPIAEVWGEHVAKGRVDVVRRAMERVRHDCGRRGIDISRSTVTVSVRPHDGQDAFARCEKLVGGASACDKCCSPYCECDGSCDDDYGTSCHRCDTWVCGYCVVDGACHDCFSKMQGGVN